MTSQQQLVDYLGSVGLELAAAHTYVALFELGPASALQLAKHSGTSRTQVYRHLEQLTQFGLVSAEQLNYGTLFRALPLENIDALLTDRQAQLKKQRTQLEAMTALMQQLSGSSGPTATTNHYYGLAGLKQVNWNLTKAQNEFRVFEVAHINQHLDEAFARRCRERYIEQGLTSFDLTNATEVIAKNIEPFAPARTHYRHIDRQVLAINFEMYIYNQTVTLLDYSKQNMHALEIHHPLLHSMMRQLFDAMWRLAKPLEIN